MKTTAERGGGTHPNGLDQSLRFRVHQRPPDILPDLRPADGGVHEVQVEVVHTGALERELQVLERGLVRPVMHQLGGEVDLLAGGGRSLCVRCVST